MKLPIVKDTDISAEKGVNLVSSIVSNLGYIFRPNEKQDYGIDGQIEIVARGEKKRHASGRLIAVQIKYGASYLENEKNGQYVHYCSSEHANYWLGHSLPVILTLCNPKTSDCHWVLVDQISLVKTKEGAKIHVPKENLLTNSATKLGEIAISKPFDISVEPEFAYEFRLNSEYAISLSDDELSVLCAEITCAFKEEKTVSITVEFENESLVAQEADEIRSAQCPTIEQRERLLELKQMHTWFTAKREHIARGIKMLLKDGFIRQAGIEMSDPPSGSIAIHAFVEYYIFHRMGQNRPSAASLDIFPESGSHSGLVAKMFLDDNEKKIFAQKLNLGEELAPLKWPGYNFIDLNHELRLKRGLPAVVTAILFFLDRKDISEKEFFASIDGLLFDWRLGLS